MNSQVAPIIFTVVIILTGCQGTKGKGTAAAVKGAPSALAVSKIAEQKTDKRPTPGDLGTAGAGKLNERPFPPTSTAKVEPTTRPVTVVKSPEKTNPPPSPAHAVPEPRMETNTERKIETTTVVAGDDEIKSAKR